jgi:hypothetical protein
VEAFRRNGVCNLAPPHAAKDQALPLTLSSSPLSWFGTYNSTSRAGDTRRSAELKFAVPGD